AKRVTAYVLGDASKPRRPATARQEPMQRLVCTHKRFLRRVFRHIAVAQNAACKRKNDRSMTIHQNRERISVSPARGHYSRSVICLKHPLRCGHSDKGGFHNWNTRRIG